MVLVRALLGLRLSAAVALALVAAAVLVASSGSSRLSYDPTAYCCTDAITSVTFVPGKSIGATWRNPDSLVTAAELHAGYTKDARGIVEPRWTGNITGQNGVNAPSTRVTFQSGSGSTIGSLSFTKDFYVQIWFLCNNFPTATASRQAPHCSAPNSVPGRSAEFYSTPYLVKVAGSASTEPATGGGSTTETVYSLSGTGIYVDTNGRVHKIGAGGVTLVSGTAIQGGGEVTRLLLKDGRVTLSKQAILRLEDGRWRLRQGTAYFNGKFYNVVAAYHQLDLPWSAGTHVRSSERAEFVVEARYTDADRVQVYAGKVRVQGTRSKQKPVLLTAGFETFIPKKGSAKPPKKFTPPAKPFWKK